MKSYSFLIPLLKDSTREPNLDWDFVYFENTLLKIFGGWTKRPNVHGAWLDDENCVIYDESRAYEIHIAPGQHVRLCKVLHEALKTFDQQEIRLVEIGQVLQISA